MKRILCRLSVTAGLLAGLFFMQACETDSADTVIRQVDIIIEGFYENPNTNENMVLNNSGSPITTMNLIQDGDQLQGVDNNGKIFRGSIGAVTADDDGDKTASILLEGETTSGAVGTMTATVSKNGTSAVIQGTWIEDGLSSAVYAEATVPSDPDSSATSEVSISASNNTIDEGGSTTLTASGGSGGYDWDLSGTDYGSLNENGATATFTADTDITASSVTQTIQVEDSSGNTDTINITISSSD